MSQIFHPAMNVVARASIFGFVIILIFVGWVGATLDRSPYFTNQGIVKDQPVPFSHEHHVGGLGIDCRYCHTSVENSRFAGMPPTKTCMTCHSQIWTNAAMLEPVRESWRTSQPLQWQRVHNLPDYCYFNHAIHVNKGVGCNTCHGPVNNMPLMYQYASLQMRWCLDCHREPEQFIRPREQVFNMNYVAPTNQLELGRTLVEKYHVKKEQLLNCSVCHR
ncbi:MAG TPA: cytochrome c3 family protein [Tepidisphaeraceae bacterium]|jgi:hypothetical protein